MWNCKKAADRDLFLQIIKTKRFLGLNKHSIAARFFDVFREYRKSALVTNRLILNSIFVAKILSILKTFIGLIKLVPVVFLTVYKCMSIIQSISSIKHASLVCVKAMFELWRSQNMFEIKTGVVVKYGYFWTDTVCKRAVLYHQVLSLMDRSEIGSEVNKGVSYLICWNL